MKDLEGIPDRTTDLCGAEKEPLPPGIEEFVADIAATDWLDEELNYLVVNTLYPHGATAKQVRRDGATAIRTLQAIIEKARELVADAAEEPSPLLTAEEGPGCKPPTSS